MDFWQTEVGGCGLDASGSGSNHWHALVNTVMNFRIP